MGTHIHTYGLWVPSAYFYGGYGSHIGDDGYPYGCWRALDVMYQTIAYTKLCCTHMPQPRNFCRQTLPYVTCVNSNCCQLVISDTDNSSYYPLALSLMFRLLLAAVSAQRCGPHPRCRAHAL